MTGYGPDLEREPFKVYPNPTNNTIHFSLEKASIVHIYDSSGRLILSQKYETGNVVIDLSQQTAGVYFLKIDDRTVRIVRE